MSEELVPAELSESPECIKDAYSEIGTWPELGQLPIVYHRYANVSFFGLEKWNRFDAWKLDKVFNLLVEKGLVRDGEQPSPVCEATEELLMTVHDLSYLEEIQTSKMALIRMTELPALFLLPNFLIQRQIVTPLKFQVAGTVLAMGIALERGWAIHIGGGMIHASHNRGAGWSPFDDLTLAVRYARTHTDGAKRVMIIDLGAHQGNGYQRDKLHFRDEDLFIVDVYNEVIFPQDHDARKAINVERQLPCGATGEVYMSAVQSALRSASVFDPDVILYAAGTNVLEDDYSGQFLASREDILWRDQLVFEFAQQMHAPICMVLSSGYAGSNFQVVADSIHHLITDLKLT